MPGIAALSRTVTPKKNHVRAAAEHDQRRGGRVSEVNDYPVGDERWGYAPGAWPGAPMGRLPPNCPIKPLGLTGKTLYCVDDVGQLIELAMNEWSRKGVTLLFGRYQNYYQHHWPRSYKKDQVSGVDVDDLFGCLVNVAKRRGAFDAIDRVRGRGGWKMPDGRFIWHAGDRLYIAGKALSVEEREPGEIGRTHYSLRPPIVSPWPERVEDDEGPARDLLQQLGTWTWSRPTLDPILVMGWIGVALMGGALDWRPSLFLTGDAGMGKSTLQALLKACLGDALHMTADTTAAGIYQRVALDCLPVAVDELEADADNKRVMAVVKLARLAASGGLMFRGGSDHKGTEFRAQSAFAFSAINRPPVGDQDRSRMALLTLGRLDPKRARAHLVLDESTPAMLLRRIMDGWHEWPERLARWRQALAGAGLDARQQDTYGTLIAACETLVGAEAMQATGLPMDIDEAAAALLSLTDGERADRMPNWRQALDHLLSCEIQGWKDGIKPSVKGVLAGYVKHNTSHTLDDPDDPTVDLSLKAARDRLQLAGLWLLRPGADQIGPVLAIPTRGALLARMYAGTRYADGGWTGALRQAPPGVLVMGEHGPSHRVKIGGLAERCTLIDMGAYAREIEEG
jgi:hypothetical protein